MTLNEFPHYQAQLLASGLTAAAYCRQTKVAYHTYLYWKRKSTSSAQHRAQKKSGSHSNPLPANNFPFLELVATDKKQPTTLSETNVQIEALGIRFLCPKEFSKSQWVALLGAVKEVGAC